ncbi:pirin family protein [Tomitella cavernea]|uniref:Pirin family protein n=1 Tax=Tomitella cavernea TaxID=1387982 RepID=A0ABP9C7S4_9ACTN|nr:pirin family protein [Tomitella cavernea]
MTSTGDLQVVRAAERHHWSNSWLDSRQSFPVTGNFNLGANAFGVLLVHNDDVIAPGEGLDAHQHASVEIVTWVVNGALVHRDSEGNEGAVLPGMAQRMSAGARVVHSERNASGRLSGERLRVVQMWVAPDDAGGPTGYAERDFTADLDAGGLVTVVSGMERDTGSGAIGIGNAYVALHASRPAAGDIVSIPAAPYVHLYAVRGEVEVTVARGRGAAGIEAAGGCAPVRLREGDAVRATRAGGLAVRGVGAAEILAWEMHAAVR